VKHGEAESKINDKKYLSDPILFNIEKLSEIN
jgi:hypothetical protein